MAADFATMQISGRMTADPKVFSVGEKGTKKAVFSVAVNKNIKRKDDTYEKKTTFIDCVAWAHTAEHVETYGKKGAKVALTGNWEDDRYTKDDGVEVRRSQINVENVTIFALKQEDGGDEQAADAAPAKTEPARRGRKEKGSATF